MKLAVILPVYNTAAYLPECLDSILNQTFDDFVVLAINDCSTDNSGEILEDYMRRDSRIRAYHLPHNQGVQGVMKLGLDWVKTMRVPYVARMDSDDVCFPHRFAKQTAFLDTHPEITVVGGNMLRFSATFQESSKLYEDDGQIKVMFLRARANIANPTAMWRNDWFRQHDIQAGQCKVAEDYAMWIDCAIKGAKFANLADDLVCYRLHDEQLSNQLALHDDILAKIWHDYARLMFPYLAESERQILGLFCYSFRLRITRAQFQEFCQVVEKIAVQHTVSFFGENREMLVAHLQKMVAGVQNQ
ncbi:glycosyltransferase family 2 protein [Alysiella crassa]|uniref:Hyaluronan synthase n=1 Tax=Alysiella crassa TaxID=153491 RepID=A0A376BNA5_9NEIS|nr:glycosyltransferase family 2 protein [Alysiella crassa]UOP06649.1 glycosyltransferase [Alysiella crassa]SSY71252.1 Hyaluronan synthase [Alysiella crassa]